MYSCLAELRKPSYHILLNPLFIHSVYVMMWKKLRMFDNLTSIHHFFFGLRSVAYRKSKAESHGVCCRVQKKPNSGLIQADSG